MLKKSKKIGKIEKKIFRKNNLQYLPIFDERQKKKEEDRKVLYKLLLTRAKKNCSKLYAYRAAIVNSRQARTPNYLCATAATATVVFIFTKFK